MINSSKHDQAGGAYHKRGESNGGKVCRWYSRSNTLAWEGGGSLFTISCGLLLIPFAFICSFVSPPAAHLPSFPSKVVNFRFQLLRIDRLPDFLDRLPRERN